MNSFSNWIVLALLVCGSECRDPRSVVELTRCVRIAEPLIHDPDYIFPLTVTEIRNVCNMWDGFEKCVKGYTNAFLTAGQQKEFEKAIEPSMQSIHQLCVQDEEYQKAYMNYAPCMKKISTDNRYCGGHYNLLAEIAESSSETGSAICCGYHQFRSCALQEAAKECEVGIDPSMTTVDGDSSHFVSSMLNRALGFLLQKCSNYEPSRQDCSLLIKGNKDLHTYSGVSQDIDGENPWNVADLLTSTNEDPTRFPSVTIKPRPYDNTFTWNPIAAGSFFPTDIDNNGITGPKSEEFRGRGGSSPSTRSCLLMIVSSLLLSRWF